MSLKREAIEKEVVELNDWIKTLNMMDSALETALRAHPSLVVIWDKSGPPKLRPMHAEAQQMSDLIAKVSKDGP